jgi:outer membrane protein assembly factor BamB
MMTHRRLVVLSLAVLLPAVAYTSVALGDWAQFLGPNRTPVVQSDVALNRSWGTQPPAVLWQTQMGGGYGGAAVFGEDVLVLDRQGNQDVIRRLSLASGDEVWRYAYAAPGNFDYPGSRSTPATDGQMVYTIGPQGHFTALRFADGGVVWQKNLVSDWNGKRPNWAVAQSPLLLQGKVIVAPWGRNAAIVALDGPTGRQIWATPNRAGRVLNYQSPVPMMLGDRLTVVASAKNGYTIGVDAETGAQLWEFGGYNCDIHIPSPTVCDANHVLLTGGYGDGGALFQIDGQAGRYTTRQLWHNRSMGSKIAQAVVVGDHIYGNSSDTGGGLRCVAANGQVVWDSKRSGRVFGMGSVLVVNDLLFIIDGRNGTLYQVGVSPEGYQELGSIRVLGGDQVWAPMSYSGGRLLLRDKQKLVCLDIRAR